MAPRSAKPRTPGNPPPAAQMRAHRLRVAVRLTAAGLGLAGALGLLSLVWPAPDSSLEAPKNLRAADLGKAPLHPITVLVIGIDSEQIGDTLNQAAPMGAANNDALLLIRVNLQGGLQVLTVPTSLAVQLPGHKQLLALGQLYRLGGAALTADAVRDLVGLGPQEPERYLVISRAGLRNMVGELGGVNANPPMEMHYTDRRQHLTIRLDGGLQRLNGQQLEQLARFQDPLRPDDSRQENHQEVARALLQQMAIPEQLGHVPGLVSSIQGQVSSNLSGAETLSLLAVGLASPERVQFSSLPVVPLQRPLLLSEIAKTAPSPLWAAP